MTDFSKILDKAKELEAKMKESQEKIKNIKVEGVSGSNSVKVILDGEGEMQKIEISDEILKEDKSIVSDLIVAAHNNAKAQLKSKTNEEINKAAGGFGIPGFKWPL
ncbi:YbaB/EbfC family nucleoid-associated protein [Candidatus Pelagibacter sp.]|nr:YbaB/EbfC family nucleoid-associated protein [Candidatus Pelagibacter sp.]